MKQRHADTKTLEMIERYFVYVFHYLDYLSVTLAITNGLMRSPLATKPRRLKPLANNPVLFPYKNPR